MKDNFELHQQKAITCIVVFESMINISHHLIISSTTVTNATKIKSAKILLLRRQAYLAQGLLWRRASGEYHYHIRDIWSSAVSFSKCIFGEVVESQPETLLSS